MEPESTDDRTATLLVVDDDQICVMAVQRAIGKLGLKNPVAVAHDGLEALELLRDAVDPSTNRLPPYVTLLDLNMPRMTGLEFLRTIRDDPSLRHLTVFVLTTSDAPADIEAAHEKNVAGYIVKKGNHNLLRQVLDMIGQYSRLVVLPGERPHAPPIR